MNVVEHTLVRAIQDVTDLSVPFALVGGFAVTTYVEPRITRDVDLAIAVDSDAAAEEVVRALQSDGYSVALLIDHQPTGRLGTVRLVSPDPGHAFVDLLFASSGIEAEIVARAVRTPVLTEVVAPVARAGDLVALKLLARSPRRANDTIDLIALAAVLTDDDRAIARAAARLIVERGFARERDLPALVEDYLADRWLD